MGCTQKLNTIWCLQVSDFVRWKANIENIDHPKAKNLHIWKNLARDQNEGQVEGSQAWFTICRWSLRCDVTRSDIFPYFVNSQRQLLRIASRRVMLVIRIGSSFIPETVAWFLTLSCELIMHGWCAHFRAEVLKECCVEEMDEEKLIEVVRKCSCLWEASSRSSKI